MAILPRDTGMLGAGSHEGTSRHFLVYAGDLGRPRAQSVWMGCSAPQSLSTEPAYALELNPIARSPLGTWRAAQLLLGKKGN